MVDKIKCKSNQRKPAMIYIDLSADKCPEIVRTKRRYRKCYKTVSISILYNKNIQITRILYNIIKNF